MITYELIQANQETSVKIVSFKNDTSLRLFSMHWHNSTELLYCRKGTLEIRIRDAQFTMKEGDLVYVNSNTPHETKSTEPNDVVMLQFKNIFYDREERYLELNTVMHEIDAEKKKEIVQLIEKSATIESEKEEYYDLLLNSVLYQLKYLLMKNFSKKLLEHSYSLDTMEMLELSLIYIEKNYMYPLEVEEIAKYLGYSFSYFSRSFKNFLGISCWHYIQSRRLQLALKIIKDSDKTIVDVALEAGFPNVKSFRQALYQDASITPKDYRQLIKNQGK